METSKILHMVTVILGVLAIIFMIFAYISGTEGVVFTMNQEHWFIDAAIFMSTAIFFALGTLIHQNIEK